MVSYDLMGSVFPHLALMNSAAFAGLSSEMWSARARPCISHTLKTILALVNRSVPLEANRVCPWNPSW